MFTSSIKRRNSRSHVVVAELLFSLRTADVSFSSLIAAEGLFARMNEMSRNVSVAMSEEKRLPFAG